MAILFDCICGTEIRALDGQAGRKVMCPSCRSDLTVPPRTMRSRPEPVPDLGIAIPEPERLNDRPPGSPRKSPSRPATASRDDWRGFFGLLGSIALAGVLFVAERAWEASTRPPAAPTVPFRLAQSPLEQFGEHSDEAFDADQFAKAKAGRDRQAEDDRIGDVAERYLPGRDLAGSMELDGDRGFLFLERLPSGAEVTLLIRDGKVSEFATGDRWTWEYASTDRAALEWAERIGKAEFDVESAERRGMTLSAVVTGRASRARYLLQMSGFDPSGAAVLDLAPIDR